MKPDISVNETLRELERITGAQRRIITIIAQDVRSPLASIASLFRLYQDKRIDPDRFNNFLYVSSTQLHSTMALLENLVLWGNIQLQPQHPAPEPGCLKEVVDGVFTELTVQASMKENRLINKTSQLVKLYMNENILRFILRNLLTNANKFTEKGCITVDGVNHEKTQPSRQVGTGSEGEICRLPIHPDSYRHRLP